MFVWRRRNLCVPLLYVFGDFIRLISRWLIVLTVISVWSQRCLVNTLKEHQMNRTQDSLWNYTMVVYEKVYFHKQSIHLTKNTAELYFILMTADFFSSLLMEIFDSHRFQTVHMAMTHFHLENLWKIPMVAGYISHCQIRFMFLQGVKAVCWTVSLLVCNHQAFYQFGQTVDELYLWKNPWTT